MTRNWDTTPLAFLAVWRSSVPADLEVGDRGSQTPGLKCTKMVGYQHNQPKAGTMIRYRGRRLAAVAITTALLMAGCGSDDDGGGGAALSGEAQEFAQEAADALKTNSDFPGDDDEADCFVSRSVDTIGFDRIEAAGISPSEFAAPEDGFLGVDELELTEDEGNRLYDVFGDCGMDLRELVLESMAEDDSSEATKACFENALAGDNLRTFFVATMVYDDEELQEREDLAPVFAAFVGCAFMDMGDAFDEAENDN